MLNPADLVRLQEEFLVTIGPFPVQAETALSPNLIFSHQGTDTGERYSKKLKQDFLIDLFTLGI